MGAFFLALRAGASGRSILDRMKRLSFDHPTFPQAEPTRQLCSL